MIILKKQFKSLLIYIIKSWGQKCKRFDILGIFYINFRESSGEMPKLSSEEAVQYLDGYYLITTDTVSNNNESLQKMSEEN